MEEFRPIAGYEDRYEVSNMGRVWSILSSRFVGYRDQAGYRRVLLFRGSKESAQEAKIHNLVYEAFVGLIPNGKTVDHRDTNKSNNQVDNLRLAGWTQQSANRPGLRSTNTSGYNGVSWHNERWVARIMVARKSIFLGRFTDPKDAARAYDAAAREHFGEFATLNFA